MKNLQPKRTSPPPTQHPDVEALKSRIRELEILKTAVEAADVGIFYLDLRTNTSTISGAWRRLMGVEDTEISDFQAEWRKRVHPDDLSRLETALEEHLAGHTNRVSIDYRLRPFNSEEWRWFRTDASCTEWDAGGVALNLVGTQWEISKRKRMELALKQSEEDLRSLVDNTPIGSALVALDGVCIRSNKALQRYLGYSADEFAKLNFKTLIHWEDLPVHNDNVALLLNGHAASFEMERRYIRKDGSVVWGHVCCVLARDADGKPQHYVVQIIDITAQRRLEEMKRDFINLASHEIRTPVTTVTGALDLAHMLYAKGTDTKLAELLQIAKRGSDRLRSILDDLLDFDRVSASTMALTIVRCDITEVIQHAIARSAKILEERSAEITLTQSDKIIEWHCDPNMLQKVLMSLLSNAAKYSPKAGKILIDASLDAENLTIRVRDYGIGIPVEFHEHAFEPFWHRDPSDARAHQSIGFGLSVSRHVIRQMGGELSIEPVDGPGTELQITLPKV